MTDIGFSKNALAKAFIIVGIVLCYFQFAVLQIYRAAWNWPKLNAWIAGGIILVLFAYWYRAINRVLPKKDISRFTPSISDFGLSLLSVLVALAAWAVWVHPYLARNMNVNGDENHHIAVTELTANYLQSWISLKPPHDYSPYGLRYPGLMVLPFVLFANDFFHNTRSLLAQRLPLVLPFLLLVFAVYAVAVNTLKDRLLAFLFSLTVATSPLLLCYTMDKYLDSGTRSYSS